MRALYVGRFQPFHLGHLSVVKQVVEKHEVIILVGSAQVSHTMENPFTAGERVQMITETLKEEGISNVYVVPVDDVNRHAVWVRYVESLVPPFDVVFSNEPITVRLFEEAGYEVRHMALLKREEWSGTEIRRRMLCDESWKGCVPGAVARIIREVDGVGRIKGLGSSDKGGS